MLAPSYERCEDEGSSSSLWQGRDDMTDFRDSDSLSFLGGDPGSGKSELE